MSSWIHGSREAFYGWPAYVHSRLIFTHFFFYIFFLLIFLGGALNPFI